jgi:hypothetical protein
MGYWVLSSGFIRYVRHEDQENALALKDTRTLLRDFSIHSFFRSVKTIFCSEETKFYCASEYFRTVAFAKEKTGGCWE